MKKKLVSLLLVAAMGVSMLVGCGGNANGDGSQGGNTGGTDGPVAITLKVWCPDNQISSGLMDEQTKAFAEANKDKWTITWDVKAVGEGDAKAEILKDVNAAADVFFYANDQISELVNAGAIARLGGDTQKMVKETMDEAIVKTVTVDDALYGIPFTHNTFFMYYDKTVISDEEAKSLDTILAKETGDDVVNFILDSAGGWKLGSFFYGAELSVFGPDGNDFAAGCDWDSETGVGVASYLIDVLKNPKVKFESDVQQYASENKLGAWFDGAWNYDTYANAVGKENLGIAVLPKFTVNGTEYQLKPFYGTKAIGVNAKSQNMAAAVAFAAYLGSEEQQIARFEKSAQVPTNNVAAATDAVKNDPIAAVILAQYEHSVNQPIAAIFGSKYWANAGSIPSDILNDKCTKENVQTYMGEIVLAIEAE